MAAAVQVFFCAEKCQKQIQNLAQVMCEIMKYTIGILSLLVTSCAYAEVSQKEFIEEFIQGDYFLIGKFLGSNNTYYGEVSITKDEIGIHVKRKITGDTIIGAATVEHATPDKIPVLRIRFSEDGTNYEETCLVDSDLDNFARITCHLYVPGKRTLNPGMEALFIKHNNPR